MATFITKALGGANFFKDVRLSMATTGEWMFAGEDGALRYVVMDSLFFSLITILRPDGHYFPQQLSEARSFMEHAQILTRGSNNLIPRLRVVVNGTFYDDDDYHFTGPDEARGWVGEVIQAGTPVPSPPISPHAGYMGRNYFIGRNGQRVGRYHYGATLPSQYGDPLDPSSKLTYAMGGLLRLIIKKDIPPGLDLTAAKGTGKTIVGYHQLTESLFVVCQENNSLISGVPLSEVANRLKAVGADVALQCDGSSSSTLIIDGTTHVSCAGYKDNTTPNGLAFKLADLELGGPKSSLNVPGVPVNTPNFDGSIRAIAATTVPAATAKLTLTVKSFGSSPGNSPESIAIALSIPNVAIPANPLKLDAIAPNNIDLRADVTFNAIVSPGKSVQCVAKLDKTADVDAIGGTVKVIQNGNTIRSGSFFWPILT